MYQPRLANIPIFIARYRWSYELERWVHVSPFKPEPVCKHCGR